MSWRQKSCPEEMKVDFPITSCDTVAALKKLADEEKRKER